MPKTKSWFRGRSETGHKHSLVIFGCTALWLSLIAAFLPYWHPFSGAFGFRTITIAAPVPSPTIPPPSAPSKEYIYVGNKLVATEEPILLNSSLNPPSNLEGHIWCQAHLHWVDNSYNETGFKIERSANNGSTFSVYRLVSANVTQALFLPRNNCSTGPSSACVPVEYIYRVRASNAAGDSTPSNTFIVPPLCQGCPCLEGEPNYVPNVALTAPANEAIFGPGVAIRLTASAWDSNPINLVEFYQGSTLLGTSTVATPGTDPPSYDFDWLNAPAGYYTLTAKAIDSQGASSTSTSINLTVNPAPNAMEADVSPRPNGSHNGGVSVADWVMIGRFAAGLDQPPTAGSEFQRADCAPRTTLGNGYISISDWVQAGRYAAGIDPWVAAGGPNGAALYPFGGDGPILCLAMPASSFFPLLRTLLMEAAAEAATGRIVRIVNPQFSAGQNGTVMIELDSQGNENAVGLSLSFNTAQLNFVSATKAADATNATLNVNSSSATNGRIGVVLAQPSGQTFASGTPQLIVVTFAAATNGSIVVSSGDQPVWREIVDTSGNTLPASFIP